ncbi:tetratricopeptide repeat protein [Flavobacterium sp. HNIBRBA15423]|uniref:tetratricopeptide repeat protein n=1 Tax=Flavobacterium sp. HNIBRBA15423 TaxID=3458683 RepID=UPI0040440933
MNKQLLLLLLISSLSSCIKEKNANFNNEQEKTLNGDFYENSEASHLNDKGIELCKNGNYKQSKEVFLKALELEPNNPTTLSNLGLNSYLDYDYENAIKYYQESYKISDSTFHIAAINLGLTYFYNEEFDKGIAITNYVIKNAKDNNFLSSAIVHRALNYLGKKECDKAQTDLNFIIYNFKEIENIEYHIKDLTDRIKNCVEHN